ncbi:MAG: glycosyltransferase [Patescibacteria group bacterium UBA2103]
MIIELVGLPASGKTYIARALEAQGYTKVAIGGAEILPHFFVYAFTHPWSVFRHFIFFLLNAGSPSVWYLKFANLFVRACALQQKASSYNRATIDQGLYQNLLSLFPKKPTQKTLERLSSLFPDNILWIVEVPKDVREARLASRGVLPREEISTKEAESLKEVSRAVYAMLEECFENTNKTTFVVSGEEDASVSGVHTKIAYATFARMPTEKAHGASIAHMCTSFVKSGFEVQLITPERKNVIDTDIYEYYGVPNVFSHTYLSVRDLLSFCTSQLCFFLQKILFARAVAKKALAPIVYTRDPEVAFFLKKKRTVVFEAHRMPSGVKASIVGWLLRGVSLVVANSKGTAQAYASQGIENIVVAPNGFDAASFDVAHAKKDARADLGIKESINVAMYVGSLELWKGVKTLFEAAEGLRQHGIETVVIGGGDKEVEKLKVKYRSVTFLGFKPYKDLAKNLQAADVLVLPNTKKDTQSLKYTSPIKLFGYMASGVPVVASDIESIREVLTEDMGVLVAPDNVDALISGIIGVVESEGKGQELAANAKEESKKYTWDMRGKAVTSAIRNVI